MNGNGERTLMLRIDPSEAEYFTRQFLTLGADIVVERPAEFVDMIRQALLFS